jgi:hypothetical protein
MMRDFLYDGALEGRREAYRRLDAGERLVCYRCRTPLVVARTFEEANRLKTLPGIYCPQSESHVFVHLQLRSTAEANQQSAKDAA